MLYIRLNCCVYIRDKWQWSPAIFDQKRCSQTRENDKSTESAGNRGILETVGEGDPSENHLWQQRGGPLHNLKSHKVKIKLVMTKIIAYYCVESKYDTVQ